FGRSRDLARPPRRGARAAAGHAGGTPPRRGERSLAHAPRAAAAPAELHRAALALVRGFGDLSLLRARRAQRAQVPDQLQAGAAAAAARRACLALLRLHRAVLVAGIRPRALPSVSRVQPRARAVRLVATRAAHPGLGLAAGERRLRASVERALRPGLAQLEPV